MFPAFVLVQAKADLDERTPFGPLGLANQIHPRLMWGAVGFARIAIDAGAHDVLPSRGAAPITRCHMIQIEILAVKNLAAILAGVFVPFKNVMPRELHLFFRKMIVNQQEDHSRHADAEGDSSHRFRSGLGLGKMMPFREIEGLEGPIASIKHGMSVSLEQQG